MQSANLMLETASTFRVSLQLAWVSVVVIGCATTDPGDGASIVYAHPRTDALVTVSVVLKQCGTSLANSQFETQVKLIGKAGPNVTRTFLIDGGDLASYRVKRSFTLGVDENGVLKSINTTNSDRTSAIVSNVFKAISTIAPALAAATTNVCNPQIERAVKLAKTLETEISGLQKLVFATPPPPADKINEYVKQINGLASMLGDLRTGILAVETKGTFTLDPADILVPDPAGNCTGIDIVKLATEPFIKWFDSSLVNSTDISDFFEVRGCVTEASVPAPKQPSIQKRSGRVRDCDFEINIPQPAPVTAQLSLVGEAYNGATDNLRTKLVAAQLAEPQGLCLDVGFGESRTVALKFDSYGQKTEFTWTSEATGETVSGFLTGFAAEGVGLAKSMEGTSALEAQKAEIDQLTTQKTLNELRHCQAVIEAGGFECPKSGN